MARIRSTKPEFWNDEKLGPLSPLTRLVYMGLWSMADDAGRIVDSVKQIDGFLFAYTEDTCREALDELGALERIKRGKNASGQQVIQILNWHHQKIDKPNTKAMLHPIVDSSAKRRRKVGEVSSKDRREGGDTVGDGSVPTTNDQDQGAVPGPPRGTGTGTATGEQGSEPTSGAGPSVRLGVATARAKDNSQTAERCSCGGILPAHLGKCAVELAERMAQEAQHA